MQMFSQDSSKMSVMTGVEMSSGLLLLYLLKVEGRQFRRTGGRTDLPFLFLLYKV